MAATAVGTMLIVGMATVIIISLPIMTSSVNAAAIVLDLAMAVATTMATIIGTRGNDGGAASGREHGGAAGNKNRFAGDLLTAQIELTLSMHLPL
jgi:hypothetical protein